MNVTPEQLDRAVEQGIISAAQRDRLLAFVAEPARESGERAPAIVAAYGAGAMVVLFAFGWFLVERWERLGAAGILVVVLLYALIFGVTSWWLAREEFPLAASFAALLAVGMTPVATWAVLELAGLWGGPPYGRYAPYAYLIDPLPTKWALVELMTALAALVTYRLTRFAPLALPVAVAGWLVPLHLGSPFVDPMIASSLFGWGSLATGSGLLLAAHVIERRTAWDASTDEGLAFDPAGWVYRVAIAALFVGTVSAWDDSAIVRHGVLVLAVVGATLALTLGRRELLAASGAAFITYLGYLAFEVFERVLSFPVVLATFGILIILLAVMAQRRWPELSARLAVARSGPRRLPGGYAIPAALFATTLALLAVAPAKARAEMNRQFQEQLRSIRESGAERRRIEAGGRPRPVKPVPGRPETPPPPAP